ncbi:MAG: hypothetical protein M1286_03880 [Candidatus Marsarchaeota archaeon]|nr:hypothetical protein [Candidatus Marsarchaeota archaeon]
MAKVLVLQENHSEEKSEERVARLIQEQPQNSLVVYFECLPQGIVDRGTKLSSDGDMNFAGLWSRINLSSHWAPDEHYKPLFQTAWECGCEIHGLDQDMRFRDFYTMRFIDWTRSTLDTESNFAISEQKREFSALRRWLVSDREAWFADVVAADMTRVANLGKAPAVVTHVGHVEGFATNLQTLGVNEILVPNYPEEERKANGEKEDEIQRQNAKDLNLVRKYNGRWPLVPAVVMAFDELAHLERRF